MNPKGAIISRISFASLPLGTCLGPCRYQGICHPAHSSALFPQQTQGDVLPANPSPYLRSFPGIVGPLLFLGFFFFFLSWGILMIDFPLSHPSGASGSDAFQFFKGGSAATLPWSLHSAALLWLS